MSRARVPHPPIRASAAFPARLGRPFVVVCLLGFLIGCLFEGGDNNRTAAAAYFPTDTTGLPEAVSPPQTVLGNGETFILTAAPVKKSINGKMVRMTGFNGSVPGPVLRVRQGDTVTVVLRNRIGFPLSLHPHGLRLDPHYDGVPGFSQDSVPDGGDFEYRLTFPDAGAFWYHTHVRQDAFLILGLYGEIIVAARDTSLWNPVDLEVPLVIGEVPLDSNGIAPIRADMPDHVMMGRFGNVFLTNGDPYFTIRVKRMSYVRFYATNACNSRVLNLAVEDNWMKIVGSDNGRYESSFLAGSEFFGPGERIVFETGFRDVDTLRLFHATPAGNIPLGRVIVESDSVASGFTDAYYGRIDSVPSVVADIDRFRGSFSKPPDKRLLFTGTMGGHEHMAMKTTASPGGTEPAIAARAAHGPDATFGVEWADTMGTMNSASTPENMSWIIRDLETGLENHDIFWRFGKGDQVMIRIQNDSNAVHSMPHPIHFHGQRFLVVSVNGKKNLQMAWKDTYLVPAGATADLLLDASNPGGWMAHCHIAEHAEDHMMFYFRVDDQP
jgi:suppressor of ftsI